MYLDDEIDRINPGDEVHRYANYVTFTTDGTCEHGDVVTYDNDGNVTPISAGDNVLGVYYADDSAPSGSECTVKLGGSVKAAVGDNVSRGDSLGSPADGTEGNGETGGVFGSSDDQGFFALTDAHEEEDEDGNTRSYALVLLQ